MRLALTPWLNHGWHVPLYVTARGLGTSVIHVDAGVFEIELDFVGHRFVLRSSFAPEGGFALEPMSVAAFYRRTMAAGTVRSSAISERRAGRGRSASASAGR